MRPTSRWLAWASLAIAALMLVSACSAAASTTAPGNTVAGATDTPTVTNAASAGPSSLTLAETNSPSLGMFLTGRGGMTLYILTADTADTSTCTGSCATNWPPLVVAAVGNKVTGPADAMSPFGTTTRDDGTIQVTYNHRPLYYYGGDSAAGDTNGQGKGGVWFVASPTGSVSPSASSSSGY